LVAFVYLLVFVLTATGAVVLAALLWVAFKSTVKTMLPELWKPGVPEVVFGAKFKVVFVKPFHIGRLEFDGDAASSFPNVTIRHVVPVCPSIAAKKKTQGRTRNPLVY